MHRQTVVAAERGARIFCRSSSGYLALLRKLFLKRFRKKYPVPEGVRPQLATWVAQIEEGRKEFERSVLRFVLEVGKDCGKEQLATEALIKTTF